MSAAVPAQRAIWFVIPAYQPGPMIVRVVDGLLAADVPGRRIVVVDDGSAPACAPVFAALGARGVAVVRHARNRGKGAALKTGIRTVLACDPAPWGVVTADADGQHAVADILRIRDAFAARPHHLVLGRRGSDGPTPRRSRLGNALMRRAVRGVVGRRLRDTQTGLRALPGGLLTGLLALPGQRYDFELEVLLAAIHTRVRLLEVDIRTIYAPGNPTSHFRAIADSLRIFRVVVRWLRRPHARPCLDAAGSSATSWGDCGEVIDQEPGPASR